MTSLSFSLAGRIFISCCTNQFHSNHGCSLACRHWVSACSEDLLPLFKIIRNQGADTHNVFVFPKILIVISSTICVCLQDDARYSWTVRCLCFDINCRYHVVMRGCSLSFWWYDLIDDEESNRMALMEEVSRSSSCLWLCFILVLWDLEHNATLNRQVLKRWHQIINP